MAFSHAFWLNVIIFCTFFNTDPGFSAFLKIFYMYNILFFIIQTTCIYIFKISFFLVKKGTSLFKSFKTLGYSTSTFYMYPLSLLSSQFFINFLSKFDAFSSVLKSSSGNFWEIPHPYKFSVSPYIKYDDSLSLL